MNEKEYRAHPALNWSLLKLLRTSPAAYRAAATGAAENKDSAARRFGRLVHAMVLEPDAIAGRYAVWAGGRRGTNAHKEWEAALPEGAEVVTETEWDRASTIAGAVFSHPVASVLLSSGEGEVAIVWAEGGLAMKAKLDWLIRECTPEQAALVGCEPGDAIIVDLKTCGDVSARGMERYVAIGAYHGQMAHYAAAVEEGEGLIVGAVVIVAAEEGEPPDVGCYIMPDDGALYAGGLLRAHLLARLAECEAAGTWEGKAPTIQVLDLPSWAAGWEFETTTGEDFAVDVLLFAAKEE